MVVVVVTFALCWLPYHVYFILGSFNIDIYKQHYIQQVSSCLSIAPGSLMGVNGMFYGFIHRCIWLFSGWRWAPPCTTPSFTTVWTKGEGRVHPELWFRELWFQNSHTHTHFFFYLRLLYRFRAGFRHAFAWCPFIKVSDEDKMELQHTHTFRVTMTRSHRRESAHAKINHACDAKNTERDAKTQEARVVKRQHDTASSSARLCSAHTDSWRREARRRHLRAAPADRHPHARRGEEPWAQRLRTDAPFLKKLLHFRPFALPSFFFFKILWMTKKPSWHLKWKHKYFRLITLELTVLVRSCKLFLYN